MPPRVRLTNEAIANINVAEKVELIPVKGGYQAQAKNEYGAEYLSTGDGTAVYPNRAAAILIDAYAEMACLWGMNAANSQHPESQPYADREFQERADRLMDLAAAIRDLPTDEG